MLSKYHKATIRSLALGENEEKAPLSTVCFQIRDSRSLKVQSVFATIDLRYHILVYAGRDASGFDGESEPLQGSTRARADIRSADRFWL